MATKKTTIKETVPTKATAKKTSTKTAASSVSLKNARAKAFTDARVSKKKQVETNSPIEDGVEVENTSLGFMNGRKVSKRTLALAATIVVIGGLLYLAGRYAVIAWVDNRPITRFQLYSNLENRYGKDMTEQLIVENLIVSEARQKNISATDGEIDAEIKKIEEQQGGADQLNQILQVQGIGQAEFRNLIKLQLLRTKIFSEGIMVSDQQIDSYIDQNKENIPAATEGASPDDKVKLRQDVKDQLVQEQVSTKFNEWLKTNLQGDRVKRGN